MKNTLLFLLSLCCLSTANTQNLIELDIPWYVSQRIRNEGVEFYNYQDSLEKYLPYLNQQIANPANLETYLASLYYAINPKDDQKISALLISAKKKNPTDFCEYFIHPVYEYLKPNGRPLRRYTMPFIVEMDLPYFIKLLNECDVCCEYEEMSNYSSNMQRGFELEMSYTFLMDQWYRDPRRVQEPEKLRATDERNRKYVDQLYEKYGLEEVTEEIISNIYLFILHSTDCEWTERWLKIYIKTYKPYERSVQHWKHFLWRSSCTGEAVKQLVGEEIERLEKSGIKK